MAIQDAVKLTYQDYLQYPDDGKHHEIIDGEHYMTAAPFFSHQYYLKKIVHQMENYLNKTNQGIVLFAPLDVILSDYDVVQPDILYVSKDNYPVIKEKGVFGTPDLVVEILSASTEQRDKKLKMDLYARYGIPGYWIVDPNEKLVFQYIFKENRYFRNSVCDKKLTSVVIPGLTLDLEKVFSPPF